MEEINEEEREEDPSDFTAPIFAPNQFIDLTRPMEVEKFKLSQNELIAWGERVSLIRAGFASSAAKLEEGGGVSYTGAGGKVVKVPERLNRRYTRKRRGLEQPEKTAQGDDDMDFDRIKKRSFAQLTFQEKMEMASDVFIDKLPYEDITRKYCVSRDLVYNLVMRMKSNKKYLQELIDRQYAREDKTQKIEEAAEMRLRQYSYIERAA